MMLSAGIEAAANLNAQPANRLILGLAFSASLSRNSPARPRDDEMPNLHVSVPGHATGSWIVSAVARSSRAACNSLKSAGRSVSLTQRKTMFWSTVSRTVSFTYLRPKSATTRN